MRNGNGSDPLRGTEYRVTWRRRTWSVKKSSKVRLFQQRPATRRFVDELNEDPRNCVWVAYRPVGRWVEDGLL